MKMSTIINLLNNHFKNLDSVVRFEPNDEIPGVIQIVIIDRYIVKRNSISFTEEMYKELEDFINEFIECTLSFNNTRSCFWSFKDDESVFKN